MMDAQPPNGAGTSASPLAKLQQIKLPLWIGVVLVVLLVAALVWKQLSAGAAERRFEQERQALAERVDAEKAGVLNQARETLLRHSNQAHLLFGTALAWAVRGEMIRNNLDQVDQYFTELVKNERIPLVLLADTDGKVLLASDRKLQGVQFEQHFPAAWLQEARVVIHPGEGQERRLVLPIQGLTDRLGTVLVVYVGESGLEA